MARYIPFEQMQKLREAARNGDERAKKIIQAQLCDKEDFSADLDDYFKPQVEEPEEEPVEDSVGVVEEEKQNNPAIITGPEAPQSEISQKILDLIGACDKQTIDIVNDTALSDATKKGALSILQEIKQSCLDNLEKFGKLMSSISKKTVEENEEIQ